MKLPSNIEYFKEMEKDRMWVHPDYVGAFEEMNLVHFPSIMTYEGGKRYKKNKFREVIRFETKGGKALFLKKHYAPSKKQNLKDILFRLKRPISQARQEIEAIGMLESLGIMTMNPIAFGEYPGKIFEGHSFIVTEEITHGTKLEQYLVVDKKYEREISFRQKLIHEIAEIANRMHTNNIHHQDFYLGHLLISWMPDEKFKICVIDLQRVHRRKKLRKRWRIKDIAQLNYSAPPIVTRIDRLRFLNRYLGEGGTDRISWIKAVLSKNTKIKKHDFKKKLKESRKQ